MLREFTLIFLYGDTGSLSLKGKHAEESASAVKKSQEVALATQTLFSEILVADIPGLSVCHRHSTGTGTEDPDLINWLNVQGADEATINKVSTILSTLAQLQYLLQQDTQPF